jgi:methionyl-tRNA synthetase
VERHAEISACYESLQLQRAVKLTLEQAEEGNRYLNQMEPWKADKEVAAEALYTSLRIVKALAVELCPVVPRSAAAAWRFLSLSPIDIVTWSDATSAFAFPLTIQEFRPLFTKTSREEIIKKLEETRGS